MTTYIALLRGINVGGNKKVEMKRLKNLFESLEYTGVSTYLNTGNIFFDSDTSQEVLQEEISKHFANEFGFHIPLLVKNKSEVSRIANAIPKNWKNDSEQKTDIAYLFPEIDFETIIDELPIKKEFINIIYVPGAIIWNVKREDYNKSAINKIVASKLYHFMTVRNVNTARYLAVFT